MRESAKLSGMTHLGVGSKGHSLHDGGLGADDGGATPRTPRAAEASMATDGGETLFRAAVRGDLARVRDFLEVRWCCCCRCRSCYFRFLCF